MTRRERTLGHPDRASTWATANNHQQPLTSPTWREHYLEATGPDNSPWLIELQLELP
ncbi:hypothetical protein ACFPJ1_15260 [Kribbella qitaiheensis]|uniref:hypothetical protein n=1 Tax=Kribbella qitaiheensis TaxID=1544730 RepID=UPI00360CCE87